MTDKIRIDREEAASYIVRNGYDWARIFLQEGVRADGSHWGYISFVSSFGNRGHCFSHMSRSLTEFLLGCNWDYLANKLWGLEAQTFHADEGVKELRARIKQRRRDKDIDRDQARECWDEIDELEQTNDSGFFHAQIYFQCSALMKHAGMYDDGGVGKVSNPQCDGFRDVIWKPFCEQLRAEVPA